MDGFKVRLPSISTATPLDSFALGGSAIYEDWQLSPGGAWNGWSPLGGVVVAPPATAMNFDGRLKIFAIGADGAVYHEWQLSAAGTWSGWALLTTPSNAAGTDIAEDIYFLSEADSDANYASQKAQNARVMFPICGVDR